MSNKFTKNNTCYFFDDMINMSVFYEHNKYYPQVFLDECLYKL